MKILFLDDMDSRHDWADKRFKGDEVHHVRTAWDAFANLTRSQFDVVSLDHDLGGGYAQTDPGDGTRLAKFLQIHAEEQGVPDWWRKATWIIHSWNHEAARNMASRLTAMGIEVVVEPSGVM